jgi:hypothetical protein
MKGNNQLQTRTRELAAMLCIGLLTGGYGSGELLEARAFRVYRDAAELHLSLDEIGIP